MFERSSNIWLFYKLMVQTWKSIVLVSCRIWQFTDMLDAQHFIQLTLILFYFTLLFIQENQNKNFFSHFSERISRVLNFIQRIHVDNYKTILISVLIILSAHSIPISNTLILFTIISIRYVRYLFNNLEIITPLLLFF